MKGGDKKPTESELQPLSRYSDGTGNVEPSAHAHLQKVAPACSTILQNYPPRNHAQGPLVQVLHSLLFHKKKFKVIFQYY